MQLRVTTAAVLAASACATSLMFAAPASATPDQNCVPQAGSPLSSPPWAQKLLNFQRAWTITQGAGVRVAVIDTGLDRTQPQLAGIHVEGGRDVSGTGTGPTDTNDCNGHGSGVAGIIAAPPMSGVSFLGVAPGATIIPIRQTGADGKGDSETLATGIEYAIAMHAEVINVSITVPRSTPKLQQAIADAAAHHVIVVAAAGNDGATTGVSAASFPAAYSTSYDNVIAVAAIDSAGQIAPFSDQGSYVDVAAPGADVVMPARQSGYRKDSGTSFATPYVSGTVALLLAAHSGLTPVQVRARLEATADPPPVSVPSNTYGYGIIDPFLAVTAVRDDTAVLPSAARGAPLPPPVPVRAANQHRQHVALAAGLGLIGLAVLACLAVVAFGRPRSRALRA
jgi:membrane-anchored mycosin MYCP